MLRVGAFQHVPAASGYTLWDVAAPKGVSCHHPPGQAYVRSGGQGEGLGDCWILLAVVPRMAGSFRRVPQYDDIPD